MSDEHPRPGCLPDWNRAELPAPPRFTVRNVLAVIGPGTIALSTSIGTGEWLLGPANVATYGFTVLWIVTLGILFQLALNLEFIRYTLYTGEPAVNGFMRTRPGPGVWSVVYILLALCQVGWPAWAALSAPTLFGAWHGRLPGDGDTQVIRLLGIGTFLLTIVIVAFGGKVERMLEWVNWFMVGFILLFLLAVDIAFVPARLWWEGAAGFFRFDAIPGGAGGVNWVLLGALAGFAGNGGIGNVWTSNLIRDKGFGMGSVVGYIPSAVGGKKVPVSPIGSIFALTPENLARWKTWWRYVWVDQGGVWAAGCFLGMYLNVILIAALIPPGTDMGGGLGPGALQAEYLAKTGGRWLWYLTLLNGFWILFGSQLTIVDGFARLSTDIVWTGSARARRWANDDIRRVYYGLLILFAAWGCVAIHLTRPFLLAALAANAAGFILIVAGIHILVLNTRHLPRELRGPWWTRAGVAGAVLFYAFFFVMNLAALVRR
jgi:hypothetical protein